MKIADVYINIPIKQISQAYSYLMPENMMADVGWRVLVPFGRQKLEGFIVAIREAEFSEIELKDIISTVDEEAWFSPVHLQAAFNLAKFYLCSPGEIMRLFIPGKSGLQIKVKYVARPEEKDNKLLAVDMYRRLYMLMKEPVSLRELQETLKSQEGMPLDSLMSTLEAFLRHRIIKKSYVINKRGSEKYEQYLVKRRALEKKDFVDMGRSPRKKSLLEYLHQSSKEEFSLKELEAQGFSKAVIKGTAVIEALEIVEKRVFRDSYEDAHILKEAGELTKEQAEACDYLKARIGSGAYHGALLHGVTGSGKTRVYMECALEARRKGLRVMVLVPEIALTGQLVQSFKSYFAHEVVVIHSQLSISERNDAIMRIRRQEAGIVIGARSALFTPIDEVGLIIMDEEQDASYKQDEAPKYHARVVGEELARLYGALFLLGSATPSLETYYRATQGDLALLEMKNRIHNRSLPQSLCVDMRQELKMGRRQIISPPLKNLILDTLAKGQQMIIMLNRRGFSTFVMCRSCGEAIRCPECSMPLVYHRNGSFLCHHCDIRQEVPKICPKCGSPYIKYFGSGTERLEQELQELIPQGRIARLDRDSVRGKLGHTKILDAFRRKEFDILLGTQMVAKGHDIPNVTAVGIISADSALHIPDFRGAERVFMLITQTAGRAGRGELPGRVVVQSYAPGHPAVRYGLSHDYINFYHQELILRKELFNPPFCRLIKLIFQGKGEEEARALAMEFQRNFLQVFADVNMTQALGPAPAMIANFKGISRQVILIKTKELDRVREFLYKLGIHKNMDITIDIDPGSTS